MASRISGIRGAAVFVTAAMIEMTTKKEKKGSG